jgi:hypothetical protein
MPVGGNFRNCLWRSDLAFRPFSTQKHAAGIASGGGETLSQQRDTTRYLLQLSTEDRTDSTA